jgi:hypothetical protein
MSSPAEEEIHYGNFAGREIAMEDFFIKAFLLSATNSMGRLEVQILVRTRIYDLYNTIDLYP